MTRQQTAMNLALRHIGEVAAMDEVIQTIYGSLCHAFPIWVRTNGLCQALAFVNEKGNVGNGGGEPHDELTPRQQAYRCLWRHVAHVLQIAPNQLLSHLRGAQTSIYLRQSRQLLHDWVFYKRFAASVLGVETGVDVAQAVEGESDA